jgi:hypothetical protein
MCPVEIGCRKWAKKYYLTVILAQKVKQQTKQQTTTKEQDTLSKADADALVLGHRLCLAGRSENRSCTGSLWRNARQLLVYGMYLG